MAPIGTKATADDFLASLRDAGDASQWVQFRDVTEPKRIGEYLSAVSNGAALARRPFGYVVWGIDGTSRMATGSTFEPASVRTGGDSLIDWLRRGLSPKIWFEFHELAAGPDRVVVLEVEAARETPTGFDGQRWLRHESTSRLLQQMPTLERDLWQQLLHPSGESDAAVIDCVPRDVASLLDIDLYLRLSGHRDKRRADQLGRLVADRVISEQPDGRFTIHRHGALLFAVDLADFANLAPKAIRVTQFDGPSRLAPVVFEEALAAGYASSSLAATSAVTELLRARSMSTVAVGEMIMNSVLHQDLEQRDGGPAVDIFSDRVEVSNPGVPLGALDRLVDERPRFRNAELVRLMFQLGLCDRRGSGFDRIVAETEKRGGLPPLLVSSQTGFTVTLRDGNAGTRMAKSDRIEAMYLHAVLRHINGAAITNASTRERFSLSPAQASLASRYIRETFLAGRIVNVGTDSGVGSPQYVPYWAASA